MADLKPTNPKDRLATHRLDLTLFPDTAVAYGNLAMAEGDIKYGGYNYRIGGVLASVYVAAARRHLAKWYAGEETDPKTGVHHLGSVLACIGIIIDSIECDTLKDDRPPTLVDMEKLFQRMEAKTKHLHEIIPNGPARYTESEHGRQKKTRKS